MTQVILAASPAKRKPSVFLSWFRESVFLANLLKAFQGMGPLVPGATGATGATGGHQCQVQQGI